MRFTPFGGSAVGHASAMLSAGTCNLREGTAQRGMPRSVYVLSHAPQGSARVSVRNSWSYTETAPVESTQGRMCPIRGQSRTIAHMQSADERSHTTEFDYPAVSVVVRDFCPQPMVLC